MPDQEYDEFGIPIKKKKTSTAQQTEGVDEFGIPIKKKEGANFTFEPLAGIYTPPTREGAPIKYDPKAPKPSEETMMAWGKKRLEDAEKDPDFIAKKGKFANKIKAGVGKLQKEIVSNDDVAVKDIKERKFNLAGQAISDELGSNMQTDATGTKRPQEPRGYVNYPFYIPVDRPAGISVQEATPEEMEAYKKQLSESGTAQRKFLEMVKKAKPEKKAEIEATLYRMDALNRYKNPDDLRVKKAEENAELIEKGELEYDLTTGNLVRPEGFFASMKTGIQQRNDQLYEYKILKDASDEETIKYFEQKRNSVDPDEPQPVPKNKMSSIGAMAGSELNNIATGAALAYVPGGAFVKMATPALVNSKEYYERGYAGALEQSYFELTKQGVTPEEAIKIARKQAEQEGWLSAAEGAVSTAFGIKMGSRLAKLIDPKAATNILKSVAKFTGDTIKDVIPDAGAAGAIQYAKNKLAQSKGIDRNSDEGIMENIEGEVLFGGMIAGVKAGVDISGKMLKKLKFNLAKIPKEATDAKIQDMIQEGQLSEEEGKQISKDIDDQRTLNAQLPDNITEEASLKIQDKIERRTELEKELETKDKAYHPEIKEKIKAVNEEIVELSKDKAEVDKEDQQAARIIEKAVSSGKIPSYMGEYALNVPGGAKAFFQEVADQALNKVAPDRSSDEMSMNVARGVYGDEIVDKAIEMFPKEKKAEATPSNITKEAEDLLKSVGEGSKPAFVTKNLERIAKENGVEVTGESTPDQIIDALKAKSNETITEATVSDKQGNIEAAEVSESVQATPEVVQNAKEASQDARKINQQGREIALDKPTRKDFQEGEDGDREYVEANVAHNKRVDDLILGLNQEGTLIDMDGVEYDVEMTPAGVVVSPKNDTKNVSYIKGKRVSLDTPFTRGFTFKPKESSKGSAVQSSALSEKAKPKIEREEDFAAELDRALNEPLAKIGGEVQSEASINESDYKDGGSIIAKSKEVFSGDPLIERVTSFLEPIVSKQNLSIENASLPNRVFGFSHGGGKIQLDLAQMGNDKTALPVALHEMMHEATRNEIDTNEAFKGELDGVLGDIRAALGIESPEALIPALVQAKVIPADKYGAANAHELVAEVFTNPKFNEYLKGIEYKGKNLLERVIEAIVAFFNKQYGQVADAKSKIDAKDMAEFVMQLTERVVSGKQSKSGEAHAAIKGDSQKNAIKELIKRAESIPAERLAQIISQKTGITEQEATDLINEVRNPPPPPQATEKPKAHVEYPGTELSMRGLQNIANEFGFEGPTARERKSDLELRKQAQDTINEWVEKGTYPKNIQAIIEKSENGEVPNDVQRVILEQHMANLSGELRSMDKKSPEFDEKLKELKRAKEAGNIARSEAGAALRVPGFNSHPIEDFGDAMVAMAEASSVDELTEGQKEQVEKLITDFEQKNKAAQDKILELQEKLNEMQANSAVGEAKAKAKKGTKKTKQDFVNERKDIMASIKEKLAEARKGTSVTILPYANELFAIAPDVAKMVRSYVEEGVTTLADIVRNIHSDLKEGIPEIKEEDVRDIIAGKYNEKQKPLTDLQKNLRDLKEEARLLAKLEAEYNSEPQTEKAKIERNQRIKALREKIKDVKKIDAEVEKAKKEAIEARVAKSKSVSEDLDAAEKEIEKKEAAEAKAKQKELEAENKRLDREFEKEQREKERERIKAEKAKNKALIDALNYKSPEQKAIEQVINRNKKRAEEIREKIAKGDFEKTRKKTIFDDPDLKKKYPKEYKEMLDAIQAREDAKHEFDLALLKAEMEKRGSLEKVSDWARKLIGTSKAIVTGIDDSAVAIQTYIALISRPRTGAVALAKHFEHALSKKKFDRWNTELHNSPDWQLIKDSGLNVTEPTSLSEQNKEEAFNNRFSGTVKFKGKEYKLLDIALKPFERAFTTLGNVARVRAFRAIAAKYAEEGHTWDNNPELFKSLAERLNTETGRGKQNENIERAAKLVTMGIWSPRLMASKLNMLGVSDAISLIPGMSKAGTKGYYRQLHPKERVKALRDLAVFAIGVTSFSYMMALAFGGELDDDPLSSTFMDIKMPNGKSYNFSGGFSGYIRTVAQFIAGKKTTGGIEKEANRGATILRFLRGKMPPLSASVVNFAVGRTFMGEETTLANQAASVLLPISVQGIAEQVKKDGASAFFTQGIPTFFGFGVKDDSSFQQDFKKLPPEIKADFERTKDDGFGFPRATATIKLSGKTVEMTDDEKKEFVKAIESEREAMWDKFKKEYPGLYQRLPDMGRKKYIDAVHAAARVEAVKKLYDKNPEKREKILKEVEAEFGEAMQQLEERKN